jgi:hypothetical protein
MKKRTQQERSEDGVFVPLLVKKSTKKIGFSWAQVVSPESALCLAGASGFLSDIVGYRMI